MNGSESEVDALTAFLRGWRVDVIQLGARRDPTVAPIFAVSGACRSHSILRLQAGCTFVVRGAVPRLSSCIWFSASRHVSVRFRGRSLTTDDLLLSAARASIDLFVPCGAVLFAFMCGPAEHPAVGANALASLRDCIDQSDSLGAPTGGELAVELQQAVAASKVLELDRSACSSRVAAVLAACRFIDKSFPRPVTLTELAQSGGVAERTLEYAFRQMYCTTPLAFIRSQRLTRSRNALLSAKGHTSVGRTARAFGFTHMGQYSRDYRRLFGETPSDTLARSQSKRDKALQIAAIKSAPRPR